MAYIGNWDAPPRICLSIWAMKKPWLVGLFWGIVWIILPIYIGMIRNHDKDLYWHNQDSMESKGTRVFPWLIWLQVRNSAHVNFVYSTEELWPLAAWFMWATAHQIPKAEASFLGFFKVLRYIVHHICMQLWLVLGVKLLMEMNTKSLLIPSSHIYIYVHICWDVLFFTLVHSGLHNLSLFFSEGKSFVLWQDPNRYVIDNPGIDLQGGLPY